MAYALSPQGKPTSRGIPSAKALASFMKDTDKRWKELCAIPIGERCKYVRSVVSPNDTAR